MSKWESQPSPMMSLDSYAANGCIVCTRSLTAPIKDVRMGEENQWNVTTDLLVLVVIVVISCVKYRERAEVRGVVFSATCFSPRLKDRQREAWLTTGSPSRHNRIGRLFLFFPTHRSTLISIGGKWTLFYLIIIFNTTSTAATTTPENWRVVAADRRAHLHQHSSNIRQPRRACP